MPTLAFFGSDVIAKPLVQWLAAEAGERFSFAGVVSQPDRPSGRGKKLRPNPISATALELGIELHRPEKPRKETVAWLRESGVDIVLVMAYGHILRRSLLEAVPLGWVNFHASVLPKYRGASPVESAVAGGEAETGVSLMRIVPAMDAGPVADIERVPVAPLDTGGSIREKLAGATVPLIARNLDALMADELTFFEQDHATATYCRKLTKDDGALDFARPAAELAARINGLDPWPGCFFEHLGQRIKIRQALAHQADTGQLPGTILEAGKTLRIASSEGVLEIRELQRPGGKMLVAETFLRGYALEVGDILPSKAMTELLSKK